jgi:polyketide cyclase/dehydrase/lipid transport protein
MIQPSVSESRDIDAPAARIFSVVSDPAMHPEVDGTGMLRSAVENSVVTQVGDVFYINMVHWHLGGYVMANHVVEFEKDRLIAWEPVVFSYENPEYEQSVGHPGLRNWGWQLEPLSDDRTRVTVFFEGSRLPEELRKFIEDGEFWRPAMATSLDNLENIVTRSDAESQESHSATAQPFVDLFNGD